MSQTVPEPAKRLQDIPEYIFARLAKVVKEVEQQSGRKVFDLGAGSPDISPSQQYLDQYNLLVQTNGSHLYPGYGATTEFADALIGWYQQRFGVSLDANELLPLNGAKDGITHLPIALFDTDEEVLVPDPGYPAFTIPAELAGAQVTTYNLRPENNFRLDFADIAQKLSAKTRYIWVNFPSNPTGQISTLEELEQLVAFAKEHNLFVLYDHAYAEITFDGFVAPSILQVAGAKDIAVEIGSFSKSHSFAGYRMGWIVGNSEIIARLAKLKSQMDSGMSLPLQGLAAYALQNPDAAWQQQMIATYQQRRDIITKHLDSLDLTYELPEGSLYIWAKIPESSQDSESFCMELLRNKHILLTPGTAYGKNGERYVRASICVNIDNIEEYFV